MNFNKHIFYLAFLPLFVSFIVNAQEGKIDTTEAITLRIDPQSARGAAVSQIFSNVKFIPLETTKESLFGSISQLKVVDNKFLIFDYDTHAVLVFSENGKFISKIGASNLQADKQDKEKANSYGFTTSKEKGQNYIVIFTSNNLQYFTMDGKFVKKEKNDTFSRDIEMSNGAVTVKQFGTIKSGEKTSSYGLILINNKTADSVGYFKYDPKIWEKDDFFGDVEMDKYAENEAFYVNFFDYNMYKVTPKKVSLAYHFIFPAINTLPSDFLSNPNYVKKRFDYFKDNRRVICGLGKSYLLGDNLFLKLYGVYSEKDQKKNLIYNLKTNELVSYQDLEPDSLSHFLPISDSGFGYDFDNQGFLAYENGEFYTSYSSLAMFTFKDRSAAKKIDYPPLLSEYFKNGDRKNNPVLIVLKPKIN